MNYKTEGTPLVVLAGKDYGMGSSRDWAAKGTLLLGVKVVIAESFERIHRSNLVGMGVLPLVFKDGQTRQSLGLTGEETFDIDTCPSSAEYYKNGGVLPTRERPAAQPEQQEDSGQRWGCVKSPASIVTLARATTRSRHRPSQICSSTRVGRADGGALSRASGQHLICCQVRPVGH